MPITYKTVQNKKEEKRLLCGECKTKTIHRVVAKLEEHGGDIEYQYQNDYSIVQCQGCREVSFCKVATDCEAVFINEDGNAENEETISRYPFVSNIHKKIQSDKIPKQIYQVYSETHNSLCSGFKILTAIGIRAIIDMLCKDKLAKGKDLFEKIDDLVKGGYLGTKDAKVLQGLRVMGNFSAHEAKQYTENQLKAAFDITEHLLATVYVIPSKAAEL